MGIGRWKRREGRGTFGGGGNKHAGASVSSRPSRESVRDELGLSVRRGTKKLGLRSTPILYDKDSARDKLALAYYSLLAICRRTRDDSFA